MNRVTTVKTEGRFILSLYVDRPPSGREKLTAWEVRFCSAFKNAGEHAGFVLLRHGVEGCLYLLADNILQSSLVDVRERAVTSKRKVLHDHNGVVQVTATKWRRFEDTIALENGAFMSPIMLGRLPNTLATSIILFLVYSTFPFVKAW